MLSGRLARGLKKPDFALRFPTAIRHLFSTAAATASAALLPIRPRAMLTPMPTRSPAPADDFDLPAAIAAVRAGDRTALGELAERYYPRVRGMVQKSLRLDFRRNHSWIQSAFSTGDVVQGVFLRVLASLKDVRCTEEGAFLGYLARTVEHHLLDALRHHQAGRRDARRDKKSDSAELEALAKAAPDRTPSYDAALREHSDAVGSVLESLSGRQRAVWTLRLEEGLPFAEVAERLGYASADVARQAFNDVKANVLVGLRRRGITATRIGG